ncbi:MAG: polyprenyl synthetase family protein [Planctomycetota bacterium]
MTAAVRGSALKSFTVEWGPQIEVALDQLLPPANSPPTVLHEAMRYVLFPGGKRLRPVLALVGCAATGSDPRAALVAAAGIECLHTYSLVHDDLPCMDDDALRRGRPTCHTVYGEATALLVGDALLTLAFQAAATAGALAVSVLARAAGSLGMVGGQMADLEAEGKPPVGGLEPVQWIHDRKTGALITASLMAGACSGLEVAESLPHALEGNLRRFGDCIGRAFQIADDCLDLTGTAQELGKNPNADQEHDKLTYPAVVGLDRSLQLARELVAEASALAEPIRDAAKEWRRPRGAALDGIVPLLQDLALAAVERRS